MLHKKWCSHAFKWLHSGLYFLWPVSIKFSFDFNISSSVELHYGSLPCPDLVLDGPVASDNGVLMSVKERKFSFNIIFIHYIKTALRPSLSSFHLWVYDLHLSYFCKFSCVFSICIKRVYSFHFCHCMYYDRCVKCLCYKNLNFEWNYYLGSSPLFIRLWMCLYHISFNGIF